LIKEGVFTMSSHIKEIPMGLRTGVSKVAELGRKAVSIVTASPQAAAIGAGFGFLAAQVLRVIF
jgi:hypothetical protein